MTNQTTVDSLTRMKTKFDAIYQKIWKVNDFTFLASNTPTEKLGSVMIEQFDRKGE